jgi:DNA-binding NarL/FixJ family response regulator
MGREPKCVSLSSREKEILELFARGYLNKQVQAELNISKNTLRTHIQNIMDKLDALNITHAVAIAVRDGLITV